MGRRELRVDVEELGDVGALLDEPADARHLLVLAHGAGAGMRHAFLEGMAEELAARRVASLRFAFPYTEAGRRRPDPPAALLATLAAAASAASRSRSDLPLLVGGKSLGGRMASLAAARGLLPASVRGLVFLGFPLHPARRPGTERARHLPDVKLPMLFLQGTRDALAELPLLEPLLARLPQATLHVVEGADHSFRVPKRSGRRDADVQGELADRIAAFAEALGPRA